MVSSYTLKTSIWFGFTLSREEYGQFFEQSGSGSPFQSWEWISAWISAYHPRDLRTVTIYEGEVLVGLWVGVWKLFSIQSAGTGPSDYLCPLAKTGYEQPVAAELLRFLISIKGRRRLDLQHWPEDFLEPEDWEGWLQSVCPRAHLPASEAEFYGSLSKSLRTDVRKGLRNSELNIEVVPVRECGAFLDAFFDLHRRRWRAKHFPGAFGKKAQQMHRFYLGLKPEGVDLLLLKHKGKPIGALYVLFSKETSYYYQAGFDPGSAKLSPGTILIATAMVRAIARRDKWFDFCRGDEKYKQRWGASFLRVNRRFVVGGTRSFIKLAHDLELKVRERLERG